MGANTCIAHSVSTCGVWVGRTGVWWEGERKRKCAFRKAVERRRVNRTRKREETNLRTARDGRPLLDCSSEEPCLLVSDSTIHKHNRHAHTAAATYVVLLERVQFKLDEHLHDRKMASMGCEMKSYLLQLSKFSKQPQFKASSNTLYLRQS